MPCLSCCPGYMVSPLTCCCPPQRSGLPVLPGNTTALLLPHGRHTSLAACWHAKLCNQPLSGQPPRLVVSTKPAQAAWCNKVLLQVLAASYAPAKGQAKLSSISQAQQCGQRCRSREAGRIHAGLLQR